MALDATSISFTFSERAITLLDYNTGAATSITASPLHTSIAIRLKDETLITPTLGELVLRGIIRGRILELAGEWGMRIETREIVLDELYNADEAFITNSLIDVLAVAEVDGRGISMGPLAQKFLAAVQNGNNAT